MAGDEPHYPEIIRVEGGGRLIDNDIKIRVSYGGPLPPEPAPVEPSQFPVTGIERAAIQRELEGLASEIEDVLRDFALPMHEAAERMGLAEDWFQSPDTIARIEEWRTNLTEAAGQRYVLEIQSRFIDAYERARVRGFFDPELEGHYRTRLLITAENHLMPGLRRVMSHQCAR